MAPPTAADLRRHADWLRGTRGGQRLFVSKGALKGAVFAGAELKMAWFRDSDLAGTNFAMAALHGLELERCDCEGADLDAVELKSARVVESSLDRVHAPLAHLEGAWLSGGTAREAGLGRTSWDKALVCGVNFAGASFKGARLTGGTFVRCDLRGVKFDDAKADGATFDRCLLDAALPGARVHQCAGLPDTGPLAAPRAQALWGWFRERLEVKPSAFEQDSPALLERDDEFFGFAVADAVLRDLVSALRFKDLAAEVNRIATASPLVRDEAQRVEALKVARRLRALIEARAAREDSEEKHLYLADASVFAVWALEAAPHLETTLAHAVRYLGTLRPMDAAHGGYAVERLARAWFQRPKDGRIPWDERQFALNNAEPGTHVGLVEQTLCERATWQVVSSGPAEVVFRHHAGVELVVQVEKDHVVSREVVKDELK